MYCPRCGIYNPKEDPTCRICALDLGTATPEPQQAVSIDLARLPYAALVKPLMSTNLLLALIAFPIVSIRYAIARAIGKPFLSKIMRSKASRMKVVALESFPRLNRDEFDTVNSQMVSDGFKKVADFEDTSTAQTTLQRLLVNRTRKLYGMVHVNAVTGKVAHVQVFALTAKGGYISLDNTHGIPMRTCPPGIAVMHAPGATTGEIFERLVGHTTKLGEQTVLLEPPRLMPYLEHVRRALVDAGIRDKVLHAESQADRAKPTSGLTLCAHHPLRQAVRQCDTCGTALCEECYTESEGNTFCPDCLAAAGSNATGPQQLVLPEGFCYAGFALRTAGATVDLLLLAAVGALVFWAIYGPLSFVSPVTARAAAITVLLPCVFAAVLYDFGYLVRARGRSIGQQAWGLYVTDSTGRKPDIISVGVRLAFKVVSVLFVLPMLANAIVLFGKRHRALHDRLADTYVVGKRSMGKALGAWAVSLVAVGALLALPVAAVFLAMSGFGTAPKVNEELTPSWEYRFGEDLFAFGAVVPRGDVWVVTGTDSIRGVDVRTGTSRWSVAARTGEWVGVVAYDTTKPFVLNRELANGGSGVRLIDVERGVVAWEQTVSRARARFAADVGQLVAFGSDTITSFGPGGKLLWQTALNDTLARSDVDINGGVLVTRWAGDGSEQRALHYLAPESGQPVWTEPQSRLQPLRKLIDGYHLFLNENGGLALMALPTKRVYWELEENIGNVVGQQIVRTSRYGPPEGFLFCSKGVVDTRTGRQLLSLPEGTMLACAGDDHLVTIVTGSESPDTMALGGTITLLDREKGDVVLTIGRGRYYSVHKAGEDEGHLYLCASATTGSGFGAGSSTTLFTIDKQHNEAVPLEIGTNIIARQVYVRPSEGLVVVPTHKALTAFPLRPQASD
ncbi:MAG: PQQ-binding-like beta-propeller repeat protein [Chitinivibrionales bacterium]|nr:PQQ-binding-like beta-propeller repeat protein [Chitinivibrionales bacterium]